MHSQGQSDDCHWKIALCLWCQTTLTAGRLIPGHSVMGAMAQHGRVVYTGSSALAVVHHTENSRAHEEKTLLWKWLATCDLKVVLAVDFHLQANQLSSLQL